MRLLCRLWRQLHPEGTAAQSPEEERRGSNAAASTSEHGLVAGGQHASVSENRQHAVDGAAEALSSILETSSTAAADMLERRLSPRNHLETLPSLIPSEINLPEQVPSHALWALRMFGTSAVHQSLAWQSSYCHCMPAFIMHATVGLHAAPHGHAWGSIAHL